LVQTRLISCLVVFDDFHFRPVRILNERLKTDKN